MSAQWYNLLWINYFFHDHDHINWRNDMIFQTTKTKETQTETKLLKETALNNTSIYTIEKLHYIFSSALVSNNKVNIIYTAISLYHSKSIFPPFIWTRTSLPFHTTINDFLSIRRNYKCDWRSSFIAVK